MTAAHKAAVETLLAGCSVTGYPEGQIPDEPDLPYWVLYMDTGNDRQTKMCRSTDEVTFHFQVTSVGLTDASVRVVAGKTYDLLVDVRPAVAAWKNHPIRRTNSIPVREDKDVTLTASNLHPMYAVDTYTFVSRKD